MKTKVALTVFQSIVLAAVVGVFAPVLYEALTSLALDMPVYFAVPLIAAIIYFIVAGGTLIVASTADKIIIKQFLLPSSGYSEGFWLGNIPIVVLIAVGVATARNLSFSYAKDGIVFLVVVIIYFAFTSVDEADYAEAGANYLVWNKMYHDFANYGLMYYLALRALATLLTGYGHEAALAMIVISLAMLGIGYAAGFNVCRYNPDLVKKPDYSATAGKAPDDVNSTDSS